MKKKLLSMLIAVSVLSQTLVFAEKISTHLTSAGISVPHIATNVVKPTVDGEVKPQGEADTAYVKETTAKDFDYRASIDMDAVRTAFTDLYTKVTTFIGTDAALKTQFDNSFVTGTFTITITHDAGIEQSPTAAVPLSLPAFQLDSSSIFEIIGIDDTTTPNTVVITAKVKDSGAGYPLTVADLNGDLANKLKNFSMSLGELSATTQNSKIYVSMEGQTEISEDLSALTPPESPDHYATIKYSSNTSEAIVFRRSGGGGGGGTSSSAPTANADMGDDSNVDVPVEKIGSNYYVDTEKLPVEDNDGNTIYGWYYDEEGTQPIEPDSNGRIKISHNTTLYPRIIPSAVTVMPKKADDSSSTQGNDISPVDVTQHPDGTFTVDMNTLPADDGEGHQIYGWDLDEDHTTPAKPDSNGLLHITNNTNLYPRTKPIAITVIGGQTSAVPVEKSDDDIYTVDIDEIENPAPEGFAFVGWYTEPNFINPVSGNITITKDTYLYPRLRNLKAPEQMISDEHILYVYGYPDGYVRPNGYITREEVAAIFCRLLKPEYRETIEATENSFPDVESSRWSNREISTMAKGGYIVGDENGYFNPGDPITRAEFTVIASKFAGLDAVPAENNFTDIENHWAKDYILKVAGQYWITGYEDLTFRPQNRITRAEAMTIVNTMLVRYGDGDSEYAKQWPDLSKSDWYYENVIEATSHNYYTRNEDGWSETWIYADEDNNSHAR